MQMSGDAGTRGAAQIHAEIHAVGFVICLEGFFDALREMHHFAERLGIAPVQFRDVRVRDDHDVARGIWKTVEDDEGLRAAIGDERFGVLVERGGIAKNTLGLLSAR